MRWLSLFVGCLSWVLSVYAVAQQPIEQQILVQGIQRQYLVLDAHRQKPAPLVMVLHGGGGNASRMLQRWQSVAQREGLIVVAPNAEKATWNALGCCGDAQQQQSADVAFIQAMLKEVEQRTSVDQHRIYVVGFSNGGMLTYQLIAQQRAPFAAAAVVSAAMFAQQPQPKTPLPLLIVHGMQDQVVPMIGGMSQVRFVARAQTQAFLPLNQTIDIWKKTNQCQAKDLKSNTVAFEFWQYHACKADLQVYLLKSKGHTWSTVEDADGIDTTQVIWDFLKQHHH
ncbi:hypothetical protein F975_02226 [Acinetobacter sp. ANC 3789]|uniref:alpha/beta hydrolase family esterase n=1 Tax=Acinetobacter sp. ANC 3789 TaxID=1217714 RepID=UPI0002CE8768|nr:PHB depolymerase family esterase [Acinetobacter sp. ANC 3789]ENU79890.1 hypothetical protein F975_02226 [Acinetobacter sp. ANC 3789]